MHVKNAKARIQKIKLRDIFLSFLFQKYGNLVPNSYLCCILYIFKGSCSLIAFEKIATFMCQSQKQNLAFKLDNF